MSFRFNRPESRRHRPPSTTSLPHTLGKTRREESASRNAGRNCIKARDDTVWVSAGPPECKGSPESRPRTHPLLADNESVSFVLPP